MVKGTDPQPIYCHIVKLTDLYMIHSIIYIYTHVLYTMVIIIHIYMRTHTHLLDSAQDEFGGICCDIYEGIIEVVCLKILADPVLKHSIKSIVDLEIC